MPHKKIKHSITPFKTIRIKYKDLFDFKDFYSSLHFWFLENGWRDKEDKDEHWETFYSERISGGAREIWIRWRLTKPADGADLTYYFDVDFHVLGLVKQELIIDGKKIKVDNGEVDMNFSGYIEQNFKEKFEKHGLLKHVLELFTKRVYEATLEQRKKEFYQEAYALQNWIKRWFKLFRHLPYEESQSFYPSSARPSLKRE